MKVEDLSQEEIIQSALDQVDELYCPLSPAAKADLAAGMQLVTADKGEHLVEEGEHSDELFFLLQGCIRAYYLQDGRDVTDWFAFEGDFVCAITSYYHRVPSPHFVQALEPVMALSIKRDITEALCAKHHDVERLGHMGTTKTMLELQARVVSLQFETARSRYESLLARYPQIEQRVPLGTIASFLGISQETLSRVRRQGG